MGGKSDDPTLGYWYYMDVLLTLCHGPIDAVAEIRVGDITIWSGNATTSQSVHVDKKEIFGGEKREGGVEGYIDIMMGQTTQAVNEYLGSSMRISGITGHVPAYRGTCNLFFAGSSTNAEFGDSTEFTRPYTPPIDPVKPPVMSRVPQPLPAPPANSFRWAANSPYFKSPSALVLRYSSGWYPEKARIGDQSNPAHIIYECLTNSEWGMGYPTGDMDDVRFRAAADTLYTENFGISLAWQTPSTIEDFIKLVLRHIDALVNQDRVTGALFLKLLRFDYNVLTLFEINPDNAVLENYSRPGLGEVINEVVVTYTKLDGKPDAVSVQDLAGITSQSAVISTNVDLPGICDPILAARVAQRELELRISPISKVSVVANRTAFALYEGDVFKLVWPAEGIAAAYYRILELDMGVLTDNKVRIEAIEDVFGLPAASYVAPQTGGWVNPIHAPAPSPARKLQEMPYFDIARNAKPADFALLQDTDCFIAMFAQSPSNDSYDYNLWSATGQTLIAGVMTDNPVELRNSASYAPVIVLTNALVKEEFSTFHVDDLSPISGARILTGSTLIIDGEWMRVDGVDNTAKTLTVARGVLDTVPVAHAAAAKGFFTQDFTGRDNIVYLPTEQVRTKVQTKTSLGLLDIATAPIDTITMLGRQNKPYCPGKFRINGTYLPEKINGDLTIAWATRNRLTQTAEVVAQDISSITPEIYSIIVLEVTIEGGTVVTSNPSGGSVTIAVVGNPADTSLVDTATDRDIRGAGFAEVVSAESTALTEGGADGYIQPYQYTQINGGWIGAKGFGSPPSRFVAATTGTTSEYGIFWNSGGAMPEVLPWTIVDGVIEWYDTLGTWGSLFFGASRDTGVRAIDHVGLQTYWYDSVGVTSTVSSSASVHHPDRMETQMPFRDRRTAPLNVLTKHRGSYDLKFTTLTIFDMKTITRVDLTLCAAQLTDLAANNHATSKQSVLGFYCTNPDEFDSASGVKPHFSNLGFKYIRDELDIIIGNIVYVYVAAPTGGTTSTSGKPSNVTSVITTHLNFISSTAVGNYTKRFTVSSSGVFTAIDSRSGIYMADRFNNTAGTGFEVSESSLVVTEINLTTGVVGATIGTLPVTPKLVYGDGVNSYIYVMDTAYLLSKYDSTLTLLASIQLPVNTALASIDESLNYIYIKGREVGREIIYRTDKSLTAYAQVFGYTVRGPYFSNAASSVLLTSSTHDHPYTGADYGFADEDGISSEQYSSATPRSGDSVTIGLGASRLGVNCYQKHSHTVKRSGYGLRWGEYYGD